MSEHTPTTDEIIHAWHYFARENRTYDGDAEEEVGRWLAAHDAEVRAQADAEIQMFREQYIPRLNAAEAALAEVRASVVAEKDAEIAKLRFEVGRQSDIIALLRGDEAELHRIRSAGVVAEEPEWEYSWEGPDWCLDVDRVWDTVEECENAPEATWARSKNGQIVRRRKAGPWLPVEQGDE